MRYVRCEHAANGPDGLCWAEPGAVQPVADEKVFKELLKIPGFSEVSEPSESFSEIEEGAPIVEAPPAPTPLELHPDVVEALTAAGVAESELDKIRDLFANGAKEVAERIEDAVMTGEDAVKDVVDKLREDLHLSS